MSKKNGSMPNGYMAMKGVKQGDMNPHVEDYQRPEKVYSQEGFNKTLEYIERHNSKEETCAKKIEGQAYNGRYS
jgi:hypothetical protein